MIDNLLNNIASSLQNSSVWIELILALVAGILTSLTPCSLSSIPLIIGYVGGTKEKNTKKALLYSIIFSLGMAITFVVFGIVATSTGKLLGSANTWWYYLLGTLMILMALQTWEIFNFIASTNLLSKNKKRGAIGALLAGILGGIFSSPCSTPVLVVLLSVVSSKDMLWGCLLMLFYAIGNSFLVIVAGTSLGFAQKLYHSNKYAIASQIIKHITGFVILAFGLYMFWLAF
jgi:cytochrome c biogenesis protein CcdA